jgi:hypothetical protein
LFFSTTFSPPLTYILKESQRLFVAPIEVLNPPLYWEPFTLYVTREKRYMMSDMEPNQSMQGRPRSSYGAYEGQQHGSVPPYETAYQQPSPGDPIDDNLVEAIAQRIAQQMAQQSRQSTGKVYGQRHSPLALPAGLRGAIAIVSVAALIPLGIVLGLTGGLGLVALAITGVIILLVNAIVNGAFSFRD